jgi:tetratricopeptide (TPR) repeat protein
LDELPVRASVHYGEKMRTAITEFKQWKRFSILLRHFALTVILLANLSLFSPPACVAQSALSADLPGAAAQLAQADAARESGTDQTQREMENSQRLLELSQRAVEASQKSLTLNKSFEEHIQALIKAAEAYDLGNYGKLDDELADILEQMDANYLETIMILEAQLDSYSEHGSSWQNAKQSLDQFKQVESTSMKRCKLSSHKSSAFFYLCFALPIQSGHYARLALSIAEANPGEQANIPELAFYAGDASFWAGDYKSAEEQLKRTLQLDPSHKFAAFCLAEVYIAQGQNARAIDLLLSARQRAANDEVRGNLDRLLVVAYTLSKQPKLARQFIESARKELDNESPREFPAIVQESSGIVSALAGDYTTAERKLSDALQRLQLSPLNLGNRLEAAQTALWRSYCKGKLGDKIGSLEDRQYALTIPDEASHLQTLARTLDPVFGYKDTPLPVGQIRDRWALVVGVGKFADPIIPRLRYPTKDAIDTQQFLIQNAGFKPDHVRVLLDDSATRATISDAISGQWLPNVVKPGDLVFLFVSSHGTPTYKEIGAQNSLVTYDTKLDHLFTTSLPMQSIARMIRTKLKRQHTFVVLDTCYSGGLGAPGEDARLNANSNPELLMISRSQLLVSSSDSKERSWESKRYQNSVFTRQLLDSLSKNPGYEDFRSVFRQVVDRVCQEVLSDFKNSQTPRLAGLWSGKGLLKTSTVRAATISDQR